MWPKPPWTLNCWCLCHASIQIYTFCFSFCNKFFKALCYKSANNMYKLNKIRLKDPILTLKWSQSERKQHQLTLWSDPVSVLFWSALQRRTWTWTTVSGRTSTSSPEPSKCFSASCRSRCSPSAPSSRLWRPSVSRPWGNIRCLHAY